MYISEKVRVSSSSSSAANTGIIERDVRIPRIVRKASKPESDLVNILCVVFLIFKPSFLVYIRYVISVMMFLTRPNISETSVANNIIINIMNAIPTIVPIHIATFLMME